MTSLCSLAPLRLVWSDSIVVDNFQPQPNPVTEVEDADTVQAPRRMVTWSLGCLAPLAAESSQCGDSPRKSQATVLDSFPSVSRSQPDNLAGISQGGVREVGDV
ncbi:hypothetical protein BDK51DRAFT_52007 [Blyttiomyces helicus]|uniref:Uncharacterized protein n=1 Tax=Blyttiomyces helicus TaxID=388810 RepID=A0A4P9W0D7_9FUNG|nr:hypothetical protein BDK51DRAFT_52007 [Blyttiomyces helicus]|eukprot:RKO85544.1 hypothetical protein BDK51DRAFT_52007 [Blyttiomyces helicus]